MRSHSGLQLIFLALLSFVLTACGGGGDSDAPSTFSVSGTATGLSGSVTLQNNGAETLTLSDNSGFTIANSVSDGTAYNVVLLNQPDGQTCSVSNGEGVVTGADVNDILVSCTDNPVSTHSIGGTVSGLSGTLVLQNNGDDDLSVSSNGSFTFASEIDDTATYRVSVLNQPAGQTCSLNNNEGTVTSADVTDIVVSCNTTPASTFSVGGTVTGLSATLVLQNNGSDELTLTSDGSFSFAGELSEGSLYTVSIVTQPSGQNCSLGNENGVISGGDVSDIALSCNDIEAEFGSFAINDGSGPKKIEFSWTAPIGTLPPGQTLDHYRILENPDGMSGFTPLEDAEAIAITESRHEHIIAVHLTDWINAMYIIEARAADGTVLASAQVGLVSELTSTAPIGYFKASNTEVGTSDRFGTSIALSADGNTLAVGDPREDSNATGINGDDTDNTAQNSGAVYVFTRNGGTWIQEAYVKASNTIPEMRFGNALALSADGNTLAVGAAFESGGATDINGDETFNRDFGASGATYVFTRSGSAWTQQAYVKASNTQPVAGFGHSVSLSADGNTLAVGAWGESGGATGVNGDETPNATLSGAVYVFSRSGNTWTQQAYVKASNTDAGDFFGTSVALSSDGDTLAVGAPSEDSDATGVDGDQTTNINLLQFQSGAAYVFRRSGDTWAQEAYIKASNTGLGDVFGQYVALSGDGNTLAVAAPHEGSDATGIDGDETNDGAELAGAVYVFRLSGGSWAQEAYVKASNTLSRNYFGGLSVGNPFGRGLALSADGNRLVVGAPGEISGATGINGDQFQNSGGLGAAYVFARNVSTWMQTAYVKASNESRGARFGSSVAISDDGTSLAIGAWGESSTATGIDGDQTIKSVRSRGAVYLY